MTQATTVVDPHVKVLDERVIARAKARDLDVLVYAPHFTPWPTIRERATRVSDDELLVVPAREIFTGSWRNRRHVLALGLEAPIPDFITLSGAMAELQRQDAVVLVPHPGFLSVSLGREQIERHREVVDAVEVYNPKHWPHHNRRARSIAADLDLPAFTSSYAHLRGTVGEARTVFERAIDDEADLLSAFRAGTDREITRRSGIGHQLRCGLEFAHLGWENSIEKVDRVVLSGTEATHPEQALYGDRFEDVRVD